MLDALSVAAEVAVEIAPVDAPVDPAVEVVTPLELLPLELVAVEVVEVEPVLPAVEVALSELEVPAELTTLEPLVEALDPVPCDDTDPVVVVEYPRWIVPRRSRQMRRSRMYCPRWRRTSLLCCSMPSRSNPPGS